MECELTSSTGDNHYQVRSATTHDIHELVRMQMSLQRFRSENNKDSIRLDNKRFSKVPDYYQVQIEERTSELAVVQDNESGGIVGMGLGRIWSHKDYVP